MLLLVGVGVLLAAAESPPGFNCSLPLAASPPKTEVIAFATGWNGPIDNGDDWRYFEFDKVSAVVSTAHR
jgi:hypothetical protein